MRDPFCTLLYVYGIQLPDLGTKKVQDAGLVWKFR